MLNRKTSFNIEIDCDKCGKLSLCDYYPETDMYEYLCENCSIPFREVHLKGFGMEYYGKIKEI